MERAERLDPRKITRETLGTASIDDYEQDIYHIWGEIDRRRSLIEIWSRVVEHSSRLAEGLRRSQYHKVQLELAGVAFWVMTFTGQARAREHREGADNLIRVQSPLSDIVWSKYPGICPLCEKDKCQCLADLTAVELRHEKPDQAKVEQSKKNKKEQVRDIAREKFREKISSLDGLEGMFEAIYSSNILASPIEAIAFHLFEEIGEVTMALTQMYTYSGEECDSEEYLRRLLNLEEELADVLSWLFSLSVKLKMVFVSFDSYVRERNDLATTQIAPQVKLSSAIAHKYCDTTTRGGKLFCKTHCKAHPTCNCDIRILTETSEAKHLAKKLMLR